MSISTGRLGFIASASEYCGVPPGAHCCSAINIREATQQNASRRVAVERIDVITSKLAFQSDAARSNRAAPPASTFNTKQKVLTEMIRQIATTMLLLVANASQAQGSCATQAVTLFADGKVTELAALFVQSDNQTTGQLSALRKEAGALSSAAAVDKPRFERHARRSVWASGSAQQAAYDGAWINAASSSLGPVQFHVAMQRGSVCKLLALHLDSAIQ